MSFSSWRARTSVSLSDAQTLRFQEAVSVTGVLRNVHIVLTAMQRFNHHDTITTTATRMAAVLADTPRARLAKATRHTTCAASTRQQVRCLLAMHPCCTSCEAANEPEAHLLLWVWCWPPAGGTHNWAADARCIESQCFCYNNTNRQTHTHSPRSIPPAVTTTTAAIASSLWRRLIPISASTTTSIRIIPLLLVRVSIPLLLLLLWWVTWRCMLQLVPEDVYLCPQLLNGC